ncbi:MAG: purine-binding chemotaxis protein CheW [Candidatus Kuenenia sp.]|nr:purine-binding chemotaxis protein CheW [Candidatus Kuenenia hertensis]
METVLNRKPKTDASTVPEHEGKYLTFFLCGEEYGIAILKVKEIMGIMNITPVPQAPGYVKGVINLRGKVIPIVDLRSKFGMPEKDHTQETCIIVVEVEKVLTGIIVDTVSEVIDINGSDIEPSPHFSNDVSTDLFLGMAKVKDKVKILLDIDAVLGSNDINLIKNLTHESV